jgi:hypothetical protein
MVPSNPRELVRRVAKEPIMTTALSIEAAPTTRTPARWGARIVTAIPVLFLAFDAAMKLANIPAVAEASARLGLPPTLALPLGILLAACVGLYVVPRTAPLGAVLLTGYLGGAVLTHARIGDPLLTHTLFPIYVGALLWTGLYLRDSRVRALLAREV